MFMNILNNLLLTFAETRTINTIFFGTLQDDCHGTIIFKVIVIILNLLLGGIIIVGTAGMAWSGAQIIAARDNANLLTKAKKRILEIVIGIVAYGFLFAILSFIIPGGVSLDVVYETENTCPEHTIVGPLPPENPSDPTNPTDPGQPTTPGQKGCMGTTYDSGGYCLVKTKVTPDEYVKVACSRYKSCQKNNPADPNNNKCAQVSAMIAGEMMRGFTSVHTSITNPNGYRGATISAPTGEDNNPKMLCNGSLSSPTSQPGSPSINRIGFKRLVKKLVENIEAGKPVPISVSVTRRASKKNIKAHRHFVVIVGYTNVLNSSNVDSIKVEFEDAKCISGYNAYDQPYVTLDGQQIKFKYIDAYDAGYGVLGDNGSRLWRRAYEAGDAWYIYDMK